MKIEKISIESYEALKIQVLRIEASPDIIAKLNEFIAKLNTEINTPKKDPDVKQG